MDHAFVINLDENVERLKRISERLNEVGIAFERFPARRFQDRAFHRSVGHRGCLESHLAAVKEANRRLLNSIVIIEDDAIFHSEFIALWPQVQVFLRETEYDIFYGYRWGSRSLRGDFRILPIRKTLCAHFWIIHSRFFQRFIEIAEVNRCSANPIPIDWLFDDSIARIYAPSINLVGQDSGWSTTAARGGFRTCRWR